MCLHVLTMCNSNSPILSNSSEEFQGIISWKSSLLSAKVRFVSLLTSAVFAEGLPASALTYGSYRMLILSLFCADAWTAGAFNPRHISQLGASTIIILYHSLLFQLISLSFQVEMKINPTRGVTDGIFTAVWFHPASPCAATLKPRGRLVASLKWAPNFLPRFLPPLNQDQNISKPEGNVMKKSSLM